MNNNPFKAAPRPTPQPTPPPDDDEEGFQNFQRDIAFRKSVLDEHFPHQGAGVHVPMWVTPALAKDLLARHGKTGHVIPHPNLK